jgi:MOB kinase activator 1
VKLSRKHRHQQQEQEEERTRRPTMREMRSPLEVVVVPKISKEPIVLMQVLVVMHTISGNGIAHLSQPKRSAKKGEKLHNTIKATMKATLGGGELRKTVKLPDGEDKNEWIAVNTVHFYNAANMIYGTCAEFCTDETCKSMSAGRNEYLWKDGDKYKKPTRVSAPIYIDLLLNWVNEQISNPNIFPVDETGKFPRNFMSVVKNIYKRLFRLYAHIYYSHFEKIRDIGANAHLNTCFKHFIFFILEFDLVDAKSMAPLDNFINKFKDQE